MLQSNWSRMVDEIKEKHARGAELDRAWSDRLLQLPAEAERLFSRISKGENRFAERDFIALCAYFSDTKVDFLRAALGRSLEIGEATIVPDEN